MRIHQILQDLKEHNTTNRELVLPVQLFQINELSIYKRFIINTLEKIQKSKIFLSN